MVEMLACQSCAMPLEVEEVIGTNSDGSKNHDYCRHCFSDGEFVDPSLTLESQMDKLAKMAVANMGMEESSALEMAENILPHLKRWKGQ